MKDIRQRLLATFQVEHQDHVAQIRALLPTLVRAGTSQEPEPPGHELDEAFRRAHSLKGAARAVDMHPVEELAHRLETLFSRVRQGVLPLDREAAHVIEDVLAASEEAVARTGGSDSTSGVAPALHAISRLLSMEPAGVEPTPASAEPAPLPSFQALETVRVTARNFDGMLRSSSGILAESYRQDRVGEQLDGIARRTSAMERDAERLERIAVPALRRLDAKRDAARAGAVTALLASVRGQMRSVSRETAAVRRLQERSSWNMRHLGRQLQRDVWQARMAPAEGLLDGYRKMMRDLARDESKEIEFRATSAGVHADRRVLEQLKDPIMHLLRNAVSHGIEARRERISRGKPPVGLVTLELGADGRRLTATLEDDGRGIDAARVAEVAEEQGILSGGEALRLGARDIERILCRPGFSTSESVTSLSGRGMGLSVVHEAIRRLEGELRIRPGTAGGTVVHLSVPMSLSTHKLLLVKCAGQRFAVPLHSIERLSRVRVSSVETLQGKPAVTIGDETIPVFGLRHMLKLDAPPEACDALQLMVLRLKTMRAAVAVDEFLSEVEAVIQDLGPAAPRDGKVPGGVVLEDGGIALVLSPAQLFDTAEAAPLPWLEKTAEPAPAETAHSILVVDDSMTTRTLEKSILEAHGYDVRVAVDGREALAQLRIRKPALVVTDVQMPHMDGFELLAAMKKDSSLARIPVIVVTSLERREDRERGLALGADAYIVKQKFDQEELLTAIRQVL